MASGLRSMSSVAVPPMRLVVEIDAEVERDMGDPRFERPRVAVRIDRVGRGQDRRDRCLGGHWLRPGCRPGRPIGRQPSGRNATRAQAGQQLHHGPLEMDRGATPQMSLRTPLEAASGAAQASRSQRRRRALYIAADGDRQRDPRPAGSERRDARRRRSRDPVAGGADRARHRPRPAVLRRQEPRLLDPPVDRLERLFLPPLAVRLRQFDGLDVAGPHAAADRHRLFADPAAGVAVPAADQDAAAC